MYHNLFIVVLLNFLICNIETLQQDVENFTISLTIGAPARNLEIFWSNAPTDTEDVIFITTDEPKTFTKINNNDDSINGTGSSIDDDGSGYFDMNNKDIWTCNNLSENILYTIYPMSDNDWIITNIPFDYELSKNITIHTKCYGFWVSYVDTNGKILRTNCIRAYPLWMNEMRPNIENFRFRDLFIPGTHDSGSYRPGFDPRTNETIVTKYSLTQDDAIRSQLMHGVRYLDIRVGYYRTSEPLFWANHGITRQRPLYEILEQVRDFVLETNEIVIFDIQEFPVGFGRTRDIHRALVHYIQSRLGELLVDPELSWDAKLKDIWQRKQNIILCYDYISVVDEFSTILFGSVEQKWGNKQHLQHLVAYLRSSNQQSISRFSSRPIADMAELTPDTWGVLTDKYGGLRKLAKQINYQITRLYQNELGPNANIVAVDFFRSSAIVDTALYWNLKKIKSR